MHIRSSANADKQHGDHETVNCNDPDANDQVRLQIGHDLWKTDYHNAGVEGRHENSDCGNSQDNPLVLQQKPTHNKQYFSGRT